MSPNASTDANGMTDPASGVSAPLSQLLAAAAIDVATALSMVFDDADIAPAPLLSDAAKRLFERQVQEFRYQGLRHWGLVQVLLSHWSSRPPPPLLEALLAVAIAQLREPRRTGYTVVDQAVTAVSLLGHDASRGFVNAILRRIVRERDWVEDCLANEPVARFNAPEPWIDTFRQLLPRQADAVLAAQRERPALTLRVNPRKLSRTQFLKELQAQGVVAKPLNLIATGPCGDVSTPQAVWLETPVPVAQLPGFDRGWFSVQDGSAQLAGHCLAPLLRDGARVLDACAAPGGKTTHLLELLNCELTALDLDPVRTPRIQESLRRLGLNASVQIADLLAEPRWWSGVPFDAILLDAPCTGAGVVRRHPEIPWVRDQRATQQIARTQRQLLDRVWSLLRPGGYLLFVTCSILPQEGSEALARFCERVGDAQRLPAPGLILPSVQGELPHDGFFYGLLQKHG